MVSKTLLASGLVLSSALLLAGARNAGGCEDLIKYGDLLTALGASKLSLAEGVCMSVTTAPEMAISAKFELDGNGRLSLSVYLAVKGLTVPADENVFVELSGSPESESWSPFTQTLVDSEHVSRAVEQATLMAQSPFSLLDIIAKAEKDQEGMVFSITPVLRDRRAQFEVAIENNGRAVEVYYDLLTGAPVEPAVASANVVQAGR